MRDRKTLPLLAALVLSGLSTGCSSGGGGGAEGFQLIKISLLEDSVWEVNREIEFTFSAPVDFTSVSLNTINIQATGGAPATGSFFLRDGRVVVFQPTCPMLADLSDSGLQAGGVDYVITVVGKSSGAGNTIRATTGVPLAVTQIRHFSTPDSTEPGSAFLDTTLGPPVPVVREQSSTELDATYLELGGDPESRVYFELDAQQNQVLDTDDVPPGFTGQIPLNLYSEPSSAVAVVIEFNQPINPSASNIASNRLRLEFLANAGTSTWLPLDTVVTLVGNCTEVGARVRLEPVGVLPPMSALRAVVLPGFQDLVGQTNLLSIDDFSRAPTTTIQFTSLTPAGLESDEFHEGFDFGGESPGSFQDTEALFASPAAEWGAGRLSAAFLFNGTGGPGGDFDWVVGRLFPEVFEFDTTRTLIPGGPGGVPTTTQVATNGIVEVRNLTIEAGSEIRVRGPNPLRISATGDVRIKGKLVLSGTNATDVATLNTGDVVEMGAPGVAGGGRGGNSNDVVTNSTPRGGRGQGPFGRIGEGGEGGETGFAPATHILGRDARRPGGGGGGRFARDQGVGLVAGAGTSGNTSARGGVTGLSPPQGGQAGAGPFTGSTSDDLFGKRPVFSGGALIDLIQGELPSLWAGYGGGGGGNADPANAFPTPNWTPASDEKGGAGGGGGGGLHLRVLGRIIFGLSGRIVCTGGRGATGENTLNLDHVGGSGGSGSGGHVILESASQIDFTDEGINVGLNPLPDWVSAVGGPQVRGADLGNAALNALSNGGAGGPGVIQLLVPDPATAPGTNPVTTDIVVPLQAVISTVGPIDAVMSPAGLVLVPEFGPLSRARSDWISIGAADRKPAGAEGLVRFLFGGIRLATMPDDPEEGKILTSGSTVTELAPLLDEDLEGSSTVSILPDEVTLEVRGSSLAPFLTGSTSGISNDIYLRTPALLQDFVLRLDVVQDPLDFHDFHVASALYDEGAAVPGDERLRLTVADDAAGTLQDFFDAAGAGTVHYRLIPRFFRVVTGGAEGALPASAYVRLRFQAAADDGLGQPDEANPLVDWTADVAAFNALAPGALQFFRFEVEFNLDAQSMGVSADTEPVTLDFLRVPFVF